MSGTENRSAGFPLAQPRAAQPGVAELMGEAMGLLQARRVHDAIAVYRRILLMYPGNADALTYFGSALLQAGQPREAADRLHEAVAAAPGSIDARSLLGNALQLTGDMDGAEDAYRGALAIAPTDGRAQNNLGVLLLKRDRPEEAAECFRRALADDPNHVQALNNLCQALTKMDEAERAIEAGRRAIEIAPRFAGAHNSLGAALVKAERLGEAIEAFRRAVAIQPRFLDALKNLSLGLVNAGEPHEAIEVTDACLAVAPGDVEVLATRSVALNAAGDTEALHRLVDYDVLLQKVRADPGPEFGSLEEFNAALARHIRTHPSLTFAPPNHATRGGMHSGDLLAEPKGPMAAFERFIGEAFERYVAALPAGFEHPFMARKPARWKLDVWGLVLPSQGYQVPHIHHSGWISACYYVQVSDAVSGPEGGHEGWIEFGRPQSIYRTTAEPDIRLVRPEEGLLVMFPSFFFHRTIPFEASAERICIAFDYIPVA